MLLCWKFLFVALALAPSPAAASLSRTAPVPRQPGATPPSLVRLRGGMANKITRRQAWPILFCSTGFELLSTYFMHKAGGFTKLVPSVLACGAYALSFSGFNMSLRGLDISVAYAVWSSIVMAVLAFIGMTFLGESVSAAKVVGIFSIISGTVLLSLSGAKS